LIGLRNEVGSGRPSWEVGVLLHGNRHLRGVASFFNTLGTAIYGGSATAAIAPMLDKG
jgi:hypothetical protein